MQCFYINLDQAVARRERIEQSFQRHRVPSWTLQRFPARDVHYVRTRAISGKIRDTEKACFVSHRELIQSNLQDEQPILVLEDDAMFGARTFTTLERHTRKLAEAPWDITFVDVLLPELPSMIELAQLRLQWEAHNRGRSDPEFALLDLAQANFAAATAYVVHGRSKASVARWLESADPLDIPYDLFMRKLVHEGRVKARSFFPFLSTVVPAFGVSQIQLSHDAAMNLVWDTLRNLLWVDRDLEAIQPALKKIAEELCDDESRALATLIAGFVSVFKPK